MKKTALIIAVLSLAVALPSLAQQDPNAAGGGAGFGAGPGGGPGGGFGGPGAGGGFGGPGGGGGFGGPGGGGGFGGRGGRGGGGGPGGGGGFTAQDPTAGFTGGGRGGRGGGRGNRNANYNFNGGYQGTGSFTGGRFAPSTASPEDLAAYQAVMNGKSIFARDRVPLSVATTAPVRQGPAPVFIGADRRDDLAYSAAIEDPNSGTISYVSVGDHMRWDPSLIVRDVSLDALTISTAGATSDTQIKMGYNLRNEQVATIVALPPPVSLDIGGGGNPAGGSSAQNTRGGRRGRGGNNANGQAGTFGIGGAAGGGGFGGAGGGFGGGGFGGGGGPGGGFGGGGFGGAGGGGFGGAGAVAPAAAPIVTSDPPLPPGNADDVAARMAARRAAQLNGG